MQTMVQLSEELVAALDREAARAGRSRSSLIREAISAYLAQRTEAAEVSRYVEGYRQQPPATPDAWGPPEEEADAHGHELALRLDQEELEAGLSW
jgi:hypothetical protein